MLADSTFVRAQIDYGAVSPMLIVFGVALLGVLVEAFVPRTRRFVVQLPLALLGLVAAFVVLVTISRSHETITAEHEHGARSPSSPPSTRRLLPLPNKTGGPP